MHRVVHAAGWKGYPFWQGRDMRRLVVFSMVLPGRVRPSRHSHSSPWREGSLGRRAGVCPCHHERRLRRMETSSSGCECCVHLVRKTKGADMSGVGELLGDVNPGWRAYPSGRYQLRYFDGDRWATYVADGVQVTEDSFVPSPPLHLPPRPPGETRDPRGTAPPIEDRSATLDGVPEAKPLEAENPVRTEGHPYRRAAGHGDRLRFGMLRSTCSNVRGGRDRRT
jgi:hypothetical protein